MTTVGMRERWSYSAKHRTLGSRGSHIGRLPTRQQWETGRGTFQFTDTQDQ